MSLGIGGSCRKVLEDDVSVIYEYCAYNLNINKDCKYDGLILIMKEHLIEPENHERVRKRPSGKKHLVTKRIPRDIPLLELITSGAVQIENCSGTWKKSEGGVDISAIRLCRGLMTEYQETGVLPESFGYGK